MAMQAKVKECGKFEHNQNPLYVTEVAPTQPRALSATVNRKSILIIIFRTYLKLIANVEANVNIDCHKL